MKNIFFTTLLLVFLPCAAPIFAQVAGNINYQNQIKYPDNNINIAINPNNNNDMVLNIKGLANIKADNYVAIFSVTQTGKTTEQVNELMNRRLELAINEIKQKKQAETYIDMISFVPMYELEPEKKIFSKKTYNEIPTGFELKKNIHIRYTNPEYLNDYITILANNEIYDLVRVDYFSSLLENTKKELMTKAKTLLQEKIKNYETILNENFNTATKTITDGYKTVLPVEMYKSYEAYQRSELNPKKNANVNYLEKSQTLYYQPIIDKEFDFVINPTVLEPVIQVLYEVKILVKPKKAEMPEKTKTYMLITPNGDLKTLNLE